MKRIFAALIIAVICTLCPAWAQKVAIFSDIHISPGNKSEAQLRRAIDEVNASDADMVFVIGDLTNEGSDAELLNVKSLLGAVQKPLYVIPGNHETTWSQSATKTFGDLWQSDRFVLHTDSLVFVAIASGPYMKMGDGHIKTEDLLWLRQVLDDPAAQGKKVISLNHYPLDNDLDNFMQYMAVLDSYPVALHINGHLHSWIPYTAGYEKGTIPGAMVRALDMRHNNYGYAIADFGPQWIHIYDKQIGKPAAPVMAFPMRTGYKAVAAQAPAWQQPQGFDISRIWADEASIFSRVAVDAGRIYFGNSQGKLRAVSLGDSSLAWEVPVEGAVFGRPALLGRGQVAFPTATGITAVSHDGKKTKTLARDLGPYVADGLVSGDLWLQGGYKRFEKRRTTDGKLLWAYDSLFNYCQGQPAITPDGTAIFGCWDTNLRCVDLKSGRLLWVWNNGKPNNLLGPGNVVPVVSGDKVIIVAPDRYMTAIDRHSGHTLWRDNSHRYREAMGSSPDGSPVYAKTMDGELVAVDATADGFSELWTIDLGLGYDHAPCIVLEHDGVVYAGSRRGHVVAVDPATHKVLWHLPLGSSEVNGFEVGPDGAMYTSLVEGTVFRIARN